MVDESEPVVGARLEEADPEGLQSQGTLGGKKKKKKKKKKATELADGQDPTGEEEAQR